MPHEEKQHDRASWACSELSTLLRLGSEDRKVHEHFQTLGAVPETIRREWMAEYGIDYAAYEAWEATQKAAQEK